MQNRTSTCDYIHKYLNSIFFDIVRFDSESNHEFDGYEFINSNEAKQCLIAEQEKSTLNPFKIAKRYICGRFKGR